MKPTEYKSLLAIAAMLLFAVIGNSFAWAQEGDDGHFVSGRIVATGIPGISAVSPVGTFPPGGPVQDKPALAVFTEPGQVLDPACILVAATSNFGEALVNADPLPGSLLSIDPRGADIIHLTNMRRFHSEVLNEPVDLAPVVNETSDNRWASNTTLDVPSDFYVANRGNNTTVRMTQTGAVVAVRRVRLAEGRTLGCARLNGIAISPDFTEIWVTLTDGLARFEDHEGAVLELPAF